jgi:hypothetical protein
MIAVMVLSFGIGGVGANCATPLAEICKITMAAGKFALHPGRGVSPVSVKQRHPCSLVKSFINNKILQILRMRPSGQEYLSLWMDAAAPAFRGSMM